MSYKLFLDDERMPGHATWIALPAGPYVIVRTYLQFTNYIIAHGLPEFVTFDHDLAECHYAAFSRGEEYTGDVPTGLDCAKWLVEYCRNIDLPFPDFLVHSMNPIGAENIYAYIESAKRVKYVD